MNKTIFNARERTEETNQKAKEALLKIANDFDPAKDSIALVVGTINEEDETINGAALTHGSGQFVFYSINKLRQLLFED